MFSKRNRRRESAPDTAAVRGTFEVLIRPDGSALIDGEDLLVPAGEPVHVAVLDALQRHAQTRGEPVEARILDATDGSTTYLSVAPDGSSEVLPGPTTPTAPPATPVQAPVAPTGAGPAPSGAVPGPGAGPGPGPGAVPGQGHGHGHGPVPGPGYDLGPVPGPEPVP
ncbi:hypothetical protein AB0954_08740, partial [Streptomyces griseoviridis]